MNVQPLRKDSPIRMVIGNDTGHPGKALMSASSRLSRPLSDCQSEQQRAGNVLSSKIPSLYKPSLAMPVIDSPKSLWYTHHASGMTESIPHELSNWHLDDPMNTCDASSEEARIQSYEQETWRLYHRIQLARQHSNGPSILPPLNDLHQDPIEEDDLNYSLHQDTRRGDDELDEPIIFDLEL